MRAVHQLLFLRSKLAALVARILGTSTFYAPLTHSLALTRGTGSPTFTRATAATVFDNEGKLITVPSGASRHVGARYVRNLLSYSENYSAWTTKTNVTVDTDAASLFFGAADKLVETSATGLHLVGQVVSFIAGNTYVFSQIVKSGERSHIQLSSGNPAVWPGSAIFNVASGTIHSITNGTATIKHIQDDVYLVTLTATALTTNVTNATIYLFNGSSITYTGDGVSGVYLGYSQLENVTGQADQTASEYVSVGVLSAPYHGLAVDGIKAFPTHKSGAPISASSLEGYLSEPAATNNLLYCRDLTQAAAWTASNVTTAKTATGIDGAANSATTLTASANNATILQPRTLTSAARSSSAYIKRRTGTGNVYITRDGGTTWTDITASLSTSSWYRAKIENSSVTNPSVGFKLATSGDAIDVDYVQDEAGAKVTAPIATTTATVTRNATTDTYTLPSGFDTAGTLYAEITLENWSTVSGTAIGDGTNGPMVLSTSNMGIQAKDGTNTASGPTGTPTGKIKVCVAWGASKMQVFVNGNAGTEGNYDGSFGLANLALMANSQGKIKNVHWIASKLSVNDCKVLTR